MPLGSPAGGGTRSMIARNTSGTPCPVLALMASTSAGIDPQAGHDLFLDLLGPRRLHVDLVRAPGRSPGRCSTARKALATVWAWTPWVASTSRIAPSQAARLRETS